MGVVSHVLANFSRKPVFGYRAMALAMCAIGLLGFLVWGHHMFVSGMSPYSGLDVFAADHVDRRAFRDQDFQLAGHAVGRENSVSRRRCFLRMGFVSFFVTGGLSGIFLAQPALDNMLHATYYVVAHFHIVMGVAAIFGIFAATYYWFPKMFGRMMNETLGKAAFLAHLRRRLLHLHADAFHGDRGRHPALRGFDRRRTISRRCSRCTGSSPSRRSSPQRRSLSSSTIFSAA